MATQWTKWFLVFVEANKLNTANNLAAQWDPEEGSATFGTVQLSPTGEAPPTHYACSTAATDTMRDAITTALGALSWASLYWTEDVTLDNNAVWQGPDGWQHSGTLYSAWLAALAHMGLERIEPAEG